MINTGVVSTQYSAERTAEQINVKYPRDVFYALPFMPYIVTYVNSKSNNYVRLLNFKMYTL